VYGFDLIELDGRDLRRNGFMAVIFATVFMGIFIAWQFRNISWSFGAGAVIALMERDIFEITVEVPAGQPPMPLTATSAGEIVGFLYPLPRCTER